MIHELSNEFETKANRLDEVWEEVFSTGDKSNQDALTEEWLVDVKANGFLERSFITDERLKDIIRWIVNAEAKEEALAVEVKRLQERHKSAAYKVKGLKKYLHLCLMALGINKFEGGIRTAYLRKGSQRVEVDEEALSDWTPELISLAEQLGALKREWKISKTALKEIPNFNQLPGVEIVTGEDSLSLR